MPAAIPPPPPAIHKPAPTVNQSSKSAENYGKTRTTKNIASNKPAITREFHSGYNPGHPLNIQPRNKHTNRLHSRKQAKLRAKRKANR